MNGIGEAIGAAFWAMLILGILIGAGVVGILVWIF